MLQKTIDGVKSDAHNISLADFMLHFRKTNALTKCNNEINKYKISKWPTKRAHNGTPITYQERCGMQDLMTALVNVPKTFQQRCEINIDV